MGLGGVKCRSSVEMKTTFVGGETTSFPIFLGKNHTEMSYSKMFAILLC